jgi:cation:H+ antiporter
VTTRCAKNGSPEGIVDGRSGSAPGAKRGLCSDQLMTIANQLQRGVAGVTAPEQPRQRSRSAALWPIAASSAGAGQASRAVKARWGRSERAMSLGSSRALSNARMDVLKLAERSPWTNGAIFLACSVVVWFTSAPLAKWAKVIADGSKLGDVVIGNVLLGAVASLPETAMAIGAALLGNAELAVNTLLGGILFATLVLAFADRVDAERPLSSAPRHGVIVLEGVLSIIMLLTVACGISAGDVAVAGVGVWTTAIVVVYVASILLIKRTQAAGEWVLRSSRAHGGSESQMSQSRPTLQRAVWLTAFAALAILAAGFVAAQAGDALANQTGLGASFVGFVLGGLATTLPEISSTRAAVREKQHEMAFSDSFGTNMFSVALLFASDIAYRGDPILAEVGDFALVATLLGALITAVYVAGLISRPKMTVLRMGIDSILVLVMSAGGIALLYELRN